jgi:PAS domain S-box-containing protein
VEVDSAHPLFESRVTIFLVSIVWSLVVVASLWSQRSQLDRTAESMAKIDAVANLRKDMAIRKWAASVGGVFINAGRVPKLETLEEQEHLSGTKANGEPFGLVALTPIHILEAIQDVSFKEYGVKERLTSQQLRNRDNAPDDWEAKALKSLEGGTGIASETVRGKKGHGLMRVMIPMRMDKECLECHRDTLVPIGGLRGGAAISVDLNTYWSAQEPAWRSIQYWHLGIWLLGLTTIFTFGFFARRHALERERRDEERRENELAFSAMAEGVIITDAEGTILWVNDAFCAIYEFARDEVIGKNPRILKSGKHDDSVYRDLWQQLKTAGYWRGELWNKRKSGEIFPEEISIRALRGFDGQTRRYISIFSDITERKRTEEELRKYREHLEDLVWQRTEELTVARDMAEAANRSKSIFLANMSHELRTPLNAVIGFSQLMDKDSTLSERQQRNIEVINRSGNHLLTLINDVLELSKIESGKLQLTLEEASPAELLREVTDMMRVRAEQGGLSLTLEIPDLPPTVLLDTVKLRQVLLNLLSNAIKFTCQGAVILSVEAQAAGAGEARLKFTVSDTGIGISPEDIRRIFEPFEQAGSASSNQAGTGLGLTISRQYLQMMGSELTVESALGQGSAFSFALTAQICATLETPGHSLGSVVDIAPADRGKHILIVDDNAEARILLRDLLEPYGFSVMEAGDGVLTGKSVDSFQPDLILMDWRMPEIDGLEATRQIRARKTARQPKVVILSAYAFEENRREALAAGANDFMRKPIQKEEFYALLEKHLGVHFIRESEAGREEKPQEPELTATDLLRLSAETRARLSEAVRELNPAKITAELDRVRNEAPELAARLQALVKNMQYRRFWQLLGIAGLE